MSNFLPQSIEHKLTGILQERWGFDKKPIVPIGICEMKVYSTKYSMNTQGMGVLEVKIQVAPMDVVYGQVKPERQSFQMVTLVHQEVPVSKSCTSASWFLHRTYCFDGKQLDEISKFKGKKFKALVAHQQKEWVQGGIQVLKRNDKPHRFFEPRIKKVFKADSEVSVEGRDYESLLIVPFGYDVFN